MKISKQTILIGLIVILIIALPFTYMWGRNESRQNDEIIINPHVESIIDFDGEHELSKWSAVLFVNDMLHAFAEWDDEEMTPYDRMIALDNANSVFDYVTTEAMSYIRLYDYFASDERGSIISAQAVLGVTQIILFTTNDEIQPQIFEIDDVVYLDEETGVAFVPLDIFMAQNTNFSFHLVYIDGQWQFKPFSLVQSIQLADSISILHEVN